MTTLLFDPKDLHAGVDTNMLSCISGVLVWRGMPLETLIDQCFGNIGDPSKGRQMPIHYGSRDFNYVTISSTVGTQTPHGEIGLYVTLRGRAQLTLWWGRG